MTQKPPIHSYQPHIFYLAHREQQPIERISGIRERIGLRENMGIADLKQCNAKNGEQNRPFFQRARQWQLAQAVLDGCFPKRRTAPEKLMSAGANNLAKLSRKPLHVPLGKGEKDMCIKEKPHFWDLDRRSDQEVFGQGIVEIVRNRADQAGIAPFLFPFFKRLKIDPALLFFMRHQVGNGLAVAGNDDAFAHFRLTNHRRQAILGNFDGNMLHAAVVATGSYFCKAEYQ